MRSTSVVAVALAGALTVAACSSDGAEPGSEPADDSVATPSVQTPPPAEAGAPSTDGGESAPPTTVEPVDAEADGEPATTDLEDVAIDDDTDSTVVGPLLFPDAIVQQGDPELLAEIADVGTVEMSTFLPWRENFQSVADAAGVPELGPARIAETEAVIAAGRDQLTDEQRAIEVSVLRCLRSQCRYLPAGTSFPGQVLDELEIARPEVQRSAPDAAPFVEVSPERYDLLGGDIILLFGTDADDALADLEQNPLWSTLEAVQNDRVFRVAPDPWFAGSVLAVEYIVDDIVMILESLE